MQDVFNILGDTKLTPSDYCNSVTKPYRDFVTTALLTVFATHKSKLDSARMPPSEYYTYFDIDLNEFDFGSIISELTTCFRNNQDADDVEISLDSAQFVIHPYLQIIHRDTDPDYKIQLSCTVKHAKGMVPKLDQWDTSIQDRQIIGGKPVWHVVFDETTDLTKGVSFSKIVKLITNSEPLKIAEPDIKLTFDLEQRTDIINGITVELFARIVDDYIEYPLDGYIEYPLLDIPDDVTGTLTIEIPVTHQKVADLEYSYFLANEFNAMYTNGLDVLRHLMYSIDRKRISVEFPDSRWDSYKVLDVHGGLHEIRHIDYNPMMCGTYVTKSSLTYHYRKILSEFISESDPVYLISKENDPMYYGGFGNKFNKVFDDTLMSIANTTGTQSITNSTLDIAWKELYQLKCMITVEIGVWFSPINNTSRTNAGVILTQLFKDNIDKITTCIFGKAAPFLVCSQFEDKCSLFDSGVNHLNIGLKYEFNV